MPEIDPTLLANLPDWLKAAPMRENLLASWRQSGQKQDPCPSLLNHNAKYKRLLPPYCDFANGVRAFDSTTLQVARTLADPERMAGFEYDQIGPLEDAIGELSGWSAFSDAAKEDQERWATSPEDAGLAFADTPLPFVDPFKGVGRNDPCPCGSGKKFKKCCLDRGSLRPSLPGLL